MKARDWAWGIAVTAAILAGLWYAFFREEAAAPAPSAVAEPSSAETQPSPVTTPEATKAEPHYPVPEAPEQAALPALPDSDAGFQQALRGLFGKEPLEAWLIPRSLIRNIVLTVDALPRSSLPERARVLRKTPGAFQVQEIDGTLLPSADNTERYRGVVTALQAVDAKALVALYLRWYPLFQQAYVDSGAGAKPFNDRLVQVIDHLLATPEVYGPIRLERPHVLYRYADDSLEQLSYGQKAMIRLGAENAAIVKAKLRQIRAAIVAAGKAG